MKRLALLVAVPLALLFAAPAQAAIIDDSWSMVPNGSDVIEEISGSDRDATVLGSGTWHAVSNGIEWDTAEVYAEVANSGDEDPETRTFAMGARVRVDDLSGVGAGYSGNVIQKGNYADDGQIKLQIIPDNGGTFQCRFKGATKAIFVHNDAVTNIDDGDIHYAYCWYEGGQYGLTVDGNDDAPDTDNVGSIDSPRNIRMGNKSPSGDGTDQHFGRNLCSAYSHGNNSVSHVDATLSAGC